MHAEDGGEVDPRRAEDGGELSSGGRRTAARLAQVDGGWRRGEDGGCRWMGRDMIGLLGQTGRHGTLETPSCHASAGSSAHERAPQRAAPKRPC